MLTTAVFVVVGCVLMAATALAQELQVGQVCEKLIAPSSGHFCGNAPTRAKYTFTNTGIHELGVAFVNSSYWTAHYCALNTGQTWQVILDTGQAVYLLRSDILVSDRTLTLTITAIEPCSDCTPQNVVNLDCP